MEKHFISFKEMSLQEALELNQLGFSVIADGDSKTIIINTDKEGPEDEAGRSSPRF